MKLPLQAAAGGIRIPDFKAMRIEDWDAALEAAWVEYDQALTRIETGEPDATVDDTFMALEHAHRDLMDVVGPFDCLRSAVNTDQISAVAEKWIPRIESRGNAHMAHPGAYARFRAAQANAGSQGLVEDGDPCGLGRLMERSLAARSLAGAALGDEARRALEAIDNELGRLSIQADRMISKAASEFIDVPVDRLAGVDPGFVASVRVGNNARIGLISSAVNMVLKKADDRQVREQVFNAYRARNYGGDNDTRATIARTLQLRTERAKLLGFDSWAQMTVALQMAGKAEAVNDLLDKTWAQVRPVLETEIQAIGQAARDDGVEVLEPWDRPYYQNRVREKMFDLDMATVRQHLPLSGVKAAMFECAKRLFGLDARVMEGVHGYHEDCETILLERRGAPMGVLMLDYGVREHKGSGAWMNAITAQNALDGNRRVPVVINVCNFQGVANPDTCLLDMEEAITVFHEFGHALHEILSNARYPSQAGTNVARDFVELPSQLMENWIASEEGLVRFAKPHGSDQGMDRELARKVVAASRFGMGQDKAGYLASAIVDMAVHDGRYSHDADIEVVEREVAEQIGLPGAVAPYHRLGHFSHLFGGGYAANYYSYLWAEVLEADVFEQFQREGLFNPELARKLEAQIYSTGDTRDPQDLVENFLGRKVDPGALARRVGAIEEEAVLQVGSPRR